MVGLIKSYTVVSIPLFMFFKSNVTFLDEIFILVYTIRI
jgi:hypothetical protein